MDQNVFEKYNNKLVSMSLLEAMYTINIPNHNNKLIKTNNNKVYGLFIMHHIENVITSGLKCIVHSNDKIFNASIEDIKNGKHNFITSKNAKKLIHITLKIDTNQLYNHVILRKNNHTIAIGLLND